MFSTTTSADITLLLPSKVNVLGVHMSIALDSNTASIAVLQPSLSGQVQNNSVGMSGLLGNLIAISNATSNTPASVSDSIFFPKGFLTDRVYVHATVSNNAITNFSCVFFFD
jgi:hypothetical protein